jgi:hypothetical protein
MAFQQIVLQLGLRGQIGGVGGRSHPGFRHFHTTKTLNGPSSEGRRLLSTLVWADF